MTETTELFRQVHPSFIQAGRVTSQAFRPTPKDNKLLSVYDGDQIQAEASWRHYTTALKCGSCGVLAVTVSECSSQSLPATLDPTPYPEHAVVDFSAFQDRQIEKKSKALSALAHARGWRYQPVA